MSLVKAICVVNMLTRSGAVDCRYSVSGAHTRTAISIHVDAVTSSSKGAPGGRETRWYAETPLTILTIQGVVDVVP